MKVHRPSDNPITGGYSSTHKGYDFAGLNLPDDVKAGMDGEIIERVDLYTTNWTATGTFTTKDYGNYIKVKHDDGSFELHVHLRKGSSFEKGTKVKKGQTIARIGNTGNSTGPHLHSEYRNASNVNVEAEFVDNQQSIIDELRTQRDANWNMYSDELKKNNDLAKQLQDEQTKSQGLRDAFDLQSKADANTGAQLLDAQHERDDYKNRLESVRSALQAPSIELVDLLGVIDKLKQPIDETVKNTIPVMDKMYSNLPKNRIKSIKEAIILVWNLFLSKFKK